MAVANREIKDGVFKIFFEEPENAAELYSALEGTPCTPEEIEIITLAAIISGKLKNDLAFVVKNRIMVIGEHMSSPCTNMPVRFLMYAGQLIEKWIKMKGEEKLLYGSKLYKIPTPEFVVFYNGVAAKPEKEILYLSLAFETEGDKSLGSLELEVPVYNINKGMNEELFKRSPKLRQYAEYIAKIREFNEEYDDYSRAVREATNYCIANDILADFLREQGGRIVSILTTEFDLDVAKKVWREEALEEGLEKGLEKGLERGLEKAKIQIAMKLLGRNRPIEEIMEDTGLLRKEIEDLQKL